MQHQPDDVIGKVRHALAVEPRVDAPRITITMIGPEIALSGVLDTPEAVRVAGEVARDAAPGIPIDNGLTVAIGPHGRTGGELARLAAEAFERTVEGLGRPVRGGVEVTEQGLARLHGNCSTAADRRALIEAVSAVPGLRDVDASDLRVAWFGTADDIRLGNIAETALIRTDPELGTIRVDVRDRTAHVRGNVREEQDRRRAIQVIEGVAGITRVIDRIRVYHAGERSSDEAAVEQRIKQALGQAGLPVPIIAVFVTSGIATLLGTVDDVDQRTRAIEVTRRVEGVSQVDCELVIASAHGRTKRAPNDIPRHPRRT